MLNSEKSCWRNRRFWNCISYNRSECCPVVQKKVTVDKKLTHPECSQHAWQFLLCAACVTPLVFSFIFFWRKQKYFYHGRFDWEEKSSAGRYVRDNCKPLRVRLDDLLVQTVARNSCSTPSRYHLRHGSCSVSCWWTGSVIKTERGWKMSLDRILVGWVYLSGRKFDFFIVDGDCMLWFD